MCAMITSNNDLIATSILTVHSIVHGKDSQVNSTAMLGRGGAKRGVHNYLHVQVGTQYIAINFEKPLVITMYLGLTLGTSASAPSAYRL